MHGSVASHTACDITHSSTTLHRLLRAKCTAAHYDAWLAGLQIARVEDDCVHANVATAFLKKWIETHHMDSLRECCKAVFATDHVKLSVRIWQKPAPKVRFAVPETRFANIALQCAPPARTQVLPKLPPKSFATFVMAEANECALDAAWQVAYTTSTRKPATNPLYIRGGVGFGKTHLAHAIVRTLKERNVPAEYLSMDDFDLACREARDFHVLKAKWYGACLILDDFELLSNSSQEMFEKMVLDTLGNNIQIVMTSAHAPSSVQWGDMRIPAFIEQSGRFVAIESFDRETRLVLLQHMVSMRSSSKTPFSVPDDTLEFLSEHLENGHAIERFVTRMHHAWLTTGKLPDTKELIAIRGSTSIKVEHVLRAVLRYYGLSREQLLSDKRHRAVAWPRQIAMYVARVLTDQSLPEIGRRFGGRDHTTILYAVRKIEQEMEANPCLRAEIENIKSTIRPSL